MKFFKEYSKIIKHNILLLFCVATSGIILTCLSSITPYISSKFLDDLLTQMSSQILFKYAIIYAVLCIGQIAISYITTLIKSVLNCRMSQELIRKVLLHLSQIPFSFFFGKDVSSLTQKIYGDSQSVVAFIVENVAQIVNNIVMIVISAYLLIRIHPLVFLVISGGIIIYIILYLSLKNILYSVSYNQKEELLSYFSHIFEQLQNNKFIKLFNLYDFFDDRLQNSYKILFKTTLKSQKVSYIFSGTTTFVTTLSRSALLILGGFLLLKNEISVGNFTALLSYFTLMSSSVNYFLSMGQSYVLVKVSHGRLQEIMNYPTENNAIMTILEEPLTSIQLIDVKLKLNDKYIIQKLSYRFERGKIYCFWGINGTGKSTAANIISGLYTNLYEGNIFINDHYTMSDLNILWYRSNKVTYSLQIPLAIKGTVYENLTLGCPNDIDKNYIDRLVHGFHLFDPDVMSGRTLSYQYEIYDLGKNVSGGELQKIQLIRSFLRRTDIYIFDEPTNSLDNDSKMFFMNCLHDLKKESIVIVVTHDSDLKDMCDSIISF